MRKSADFDVPLHSKIKKSWLTDLAGFAAFAKSLILRNYGNKPQNNPKPAKKALKKVDFSAKPRKK